MNRINVVIVSLLASSAAYRGVNFQSEMGPITFNKGNNNITEHRAIFQREIQNS